MLTHFKRRFQVSEEGALGLKRATRSTLLVNLLSMAPIIILMLFGEAVFEGVKRLPLFLGGLSLLVAIALLIALRVEYDRLYSATYRESAELRIRLAKTLSKLPLDYFSRHDLSDLAQTMMTDVEALEHAMSHAIPKVYGLYVFLPLIGIMMVIGNVKLGLAVVLPQILRFVVLIAFKDKTLEGNAAFHRKLRENSDAFQEAIEMHREIRGYNLTDALKRDLYEKMEASEAIHFDAEKRPLIALSISTLLSFLSLAICIYLGLHGLIAGEVSLLYVLGYILAAMKVKELVDVSSEVTLEVLYIAPRVNRLKEMNEHPLQRGREVELTRFDVELEDVSFGYGDQSVLDGVSFTASQGEVTALVGPSGCGKTTLLKLISRLYDYDSGRIAISGYDIKSISTDALFRATSIVFQDVVLFNTSVMENIRIGKPEATDGEVEEAARLAGLEDVIAELPEGIRTVIGENGSELSGGQRQRISIARAFLKDAPILILDEIASSLDVENERAIQRSLNRLIQNKTVIVISHRLKSVEGVDKIVVLKDGKIEAQGHHQELLDTSPTYRNLIEKSERAEEFTY